MRTLAIGCNQPLRPLVWEEHGRPEGLEPDVIRSVCERLGWHPTWRYRPWPDLPDLLDAGEFDCLMLNFCWTEERAARFALSRPYGGTDMAVLARAGSGLGAPAGLEGRVVGVVRGTTNLDRARSLAGVAEVRVYDPGMKVMGMMVEDVRAGAIDGALDDEVPFRAIAAADPALEVAFTIPTGNLYVIAFRRADASLRDLIDTALGELAAAGELGRLFELHAGRQLPPGVAG
ncbi:MAG: amino acid ABC transporter substrate-binding protein [Thermoleophilia bacterium]|nr:amino acid ABC transporter substrate-binding protein [Thermoleophilia bacterium]